MEKNQDMYHLSLKNALKGQSKKLDLVTNDLKIKNTLNKSKSYNLLKSNNNNKFNPSQIQQVKTMNKKLGFDKINSEKNFKTNKIVPNTDYLPKRNILSNNKNLIKNEHNIHKTYSKTKLELSNHSKLQKNVGLSKNVHKEDVKVKLNSNKFYNNAGLNSKNIKMGEIKIKEENLQNSKSLTKIITHRSKTVNSNPFIIEKKHRT